MDVNRVNNKVNTKQSQFPNSILFEITPISHRMRLHDKEIRQANKKKLAIIVVILISINYTKTFNRKYISFRIKSHLHFDI